ncbi:MAG TPA: type II secretion system protein [Pirellulaceae bacterium]|nr:type II secretion system protein [Pirellulaceae bacterium]
MIPRIRGSRSAFTLIELLIVIAVIGLMSSAILFAMYGLLDEAKADRTRGQIARLDGLITDRWEAYRVRTVPVALPTNANPNAAATTRLLAIRDLMRMEMPDRITDISDPPVVLYTDSNGRPVRLPIPALLRGYRRRCFAILGPGAGGQPDYSKWSRSHEGAECLYLILTSMNEEGSNAALDFFGPTEIDDTDGDGMPEVLDAWRVPIQFLRWAPGFLSDRQTRDATIDPDPFDPMKVDPRWNDNTAPNISLPNGNEPFLLFPLIFSAGPDNKFDINTEGATTPAMSGVFHYAGTTPILIDPYWIGDPAAPSPQIGQLGDANGDGVLSYSDNIHNHLLQVK